MIRLFATATILFLLPFALYAIYAYVLKETAPDPNAPSPRPPFAWLAAAGGLLSIGTFIWFGLQSATVPSGNYVPSVYKDGKILPGRFE